jgi:hypothetical protein
MISTVADYNLEMCTTVKVSVSIHKILIVNFTFLQHLKKQKNVFLFTGLYSKGTLMYFSDVAVSENDNKSTLLQYGISFS